MDDIEQFIEDNRVAYLNILTELDPILSYLRKMPINSKEWLFFKEIYAEFVNEKETCGKKVRYLSKGMLKLTNKNSATTQWFQWYLGVFEGVNNTVLDTLILLINSTGIISPDIPSNMPRKIVKAIRKQELKKSHIPVNTKNSYLSCYGLKTIVCMVDTQTRNRIAHVNYEIRDDEVFFEDGKAFSIIAKKLTDLLRLLMVIDNILKGIICEKEGIHFDR